jgi:hypothetical protein
MGPRPGAPADKHCPPESKISVVRMKILPSAVQEACKWIARLLPRVLWLTALALLLVWLLKTQQALVYNRKYVVSIIQFHFLFMFLAWPVCMVEAILSYRTPLVALHSRKYVYLSGFVFIIDEGIPLTIDFGNRYCHCIH